MDTKALAPYVIMLICVILLGAGKARAQTPEIPAETARAERIEEAADLETVRPEPAVPETEKAQEIERAQEEPGPSPVMDRYRQVFFSDEEMDELAGIIYLEARGEPARGQQAVAEVVLNRVLSPEFPDTVSEVIHQGEAEGSAQFDTVYDLDTAAPGPEQYEAIDRAMHGPGVVPSDVVFFSREGENDRVFMTIGEHVFCRGYLWD